MFVLVLGLDSGGINTEMRTLSGFWSRQRRNIGFIEILLKKPT